MTANSRTIALEGRGLTKVFGTGELAVTALHPTDIAVHEGEVLVIMGPSGSGKTTLLSMLGLVLSPSGGEVRLGGDNVTHAPADELALIRRQRLGFVFQQFNLLPSLSALENAAVPLLLAGVPRRERLARAAAALALVGVSARASHRPRLLSGGQQQRVAIARALVAGAPVLLCDEPTASLDGETGRGILAALRELADRERRAVVIVTHDDRVRAIADRFVHVVDGRVTSDGGHIHEDTPTHSEVNHD
jgi:ABC-type lipoprotein export system ATPase subunit